MNQRLDLQQHMQQQARPGAKVRTTVQHKGQPAYADSWVPGSATKLMSQGRATRATRSQIILEEQRSVALDGRRHAEGLEHRDVDVACLKQAKREDATLRHGTELQTTTVRYTSGIRQRHCKSSNI